MIQFLHEFNNYLYAYVLIVILIGCGLYFTIRTRVVQMRLFKESCRLLVKSNDGHSDKKHISYFQAFALAVASRVGVGNIAGVAIALTFFVFSTLITFYYYGEANLKFCTQKKWAVPVFKILVLAGLMAGFCASLDLVWEFTDTLMAFCGIFNLIALVILSPKVFALTEDYMKQKKSGIKDPVLKKWWK